ncbi:hypothetical protein [Sphingobium sp. YR768]|uniref:hypothetical protein n=1 Tax=Sphingobium sp. YR768 TaxID=1884365 RepID=UPI0008C6A16E|nr:hypothetical protein [Sphingobium sp. YR768]SEQ59751.1 hypothetical protein SAMN05518866_101466 [Sphingobium sp. YR768]
MTAEPAPTFNELCERVRQTRHAHGAAIRARGAAEDKVKELEAAEKAAAEAESDAMYALEDFIDRETAVTPQGE